MSQESQNSLEESFSSQIQQQYPPQFKDEFKCIICQAKYNLNDRYPINTCADQHHACLSCIENLIKDNQPCRVCNRPFQKRLIHKNKFIVNLLSKTVSIKRYKVIIIQNPEDRIRNLLPDKAPKIHPNNFQQNKNNENIPKNNYNTSPIISQQPLHDTNSIPLFPNSNHPINFGYHQNQFNNYGPNYQPHAFMVDRVEAGTLAQWQKKLKPKFQGRYTVLFWTSLVFLVVFQVFASLQLGGYIFSVRKGTCYYMADRNDNKIYVSLDTFNAKLLMQSFITRTVFFLPGIVFGILSVKLQKFRYPAFVTYIVFFFLALFIHSIFVISIGRNVQEFRENYHSSDVSYDVLLERCIGEFKFLVKEEFAIIQGVIQMLFSIGFMCFFIVGACSKPKQNPLLNH